MLASRFFVVPALACALATAVACGGDGEGARRDARNDAVVLGADAALPVAARPTTGLPCDVQTLFEDRCLGCHDGRIAELPRLLDYADLVAPSKSDPTQPLATIALWRMKGTTRPMPPRPAAEPDVEEISTLARWIAAGTPKGAGCTDVPIDGGADDASDTGTDPTLASFCAPLVKGCKAANPVDTITEASCEAIAEGLNAAGRAALTSCFETESNCGDCPGLVE